MTTDKDGAILLCQARENSLHSISGEIGLTKITNNITLKMATTRHSVFMYCATPALEATNFT